MENYLNYFFLSTLKSGLYSGGKRTVYRGQDRFKKISVEGSQDRCITRVHRLPFRQCASKAFQYQSHIWEGRMNNMQRCDTKLFQHRRIDFCLFKLLYKKKKNRKDHENIPSFCVSIFGKFKQKNITKYVSS